MNILAVLRVVGVLLLGTSLAMVPSIILSVGEGNLGGWLIAAGVFVAYATVFETFIGATPGKRILRCRVVDERGQPCRFGAVAVRNLIRLIEMFYLFQLMPAIILIMLTRNRQRLGDLLAGTLVIEGTARYGNADS